MHDYLKWYPWNPYTFWSDTRIDDLDLDTMAVYRSLLDHMWMHATAMLPDIDKHNARRTRCPTTKEFRHHKLELINCGLIVINGEWLQSPELTKIKELAEKAYKNVRKND